MSLFSRTVLVSAMIAAALSSRPAMAIVFTGDVNIDFSVSGVEVYLDPVGDVGLPLNAPPMTISGRDYSSVAFILDEGTDMLHVGINFKHLVMV